MVPFGHLEFASTREGRFYYTFDIVTAIIYARGLSGTTIVCRFTEWMIENLKILAIAKLIRILSFVVLQKPIWEIKTSMFNPLATFQYTYLHVDMELG